MFLTLKDEQNEPSNSGINIPDGAEYVQEIPISEISDFPDHPFKVRQDEAMLNMTESIRENGVRQPAIVRPMPDGGYQMLSGHRRKAACMVIGKLAIPAVVREMSDDEAIICMVEANHQRENILPSERAFSYKMQLEAMKRQAGRPAKNNSAQVALDFQGNVSLQDGLSGKSIDQGYLKSRKSNVGRHEIDPLIMVQDPLIRIKLLVLNQAMHMVSDGDMQFIRCMPAESIR